MAAMAKSKVDPTKSIPPEEIDMDGILIDDAFLASKELSLPAKMIYLIIRRELHRKKQNFTTRLTNKRLAAMVAVSPKTVQRAINEELAENGHIAVVSVNSVTGRAKKGIPPEIRGTRWIYLDKKLAGYRQRALNKAKKQNPVELLYSLLVLEKGVPEDVYVHTMRRYAAEERERLEQEDENRYFAAFKESLADLSDEQVAELEVQAKESPGTYLKLRSEEREKRRAFEAMTDDDDGLFDDQDDEEHDEFTGL